MVKIAAYCVAFAVIGFVWYLCIRSIIRTSRRIGAIKRHAAKLMAQRPVLTHSEFGAQFFPPNEREVAGRLRKMLEQILIVDVTRVYPDDRLIEDLGFGRVDGLDPDFLEVDVRDAFGVDLTPAWRSAVTVRDLVSYITSQGAASSTRHD